MIERIERYRSRHHSLHQQLEDWRQDPASFIESHLINPETRLPFALLAAERNFLAHCFQLDENGRLEFPEQLYACPKKSGKTGFAALHLLTTLLLFGGQYAEAYTVANDYEQSVARVFEQVRRIVEVSPLLFREAKVSADRISFPELGATITALASDYSSAAGGHPTISCFDELWAYTSERARRLYDELVPVPTRKVSCRLTVTHAGFEGESVLLQELYRRGLQQPHVAAGLYAGDGLLMFWSHQPIAPWQTEDWLADMRRSLRPLQFQRMIENRWVGSESAFIEMQQWDQCVDPNARPVAVDRRLPVWIGVDASVKHDSTALVAVTFDVATQRVRLVNHRVFQPRPDRPIDFERQVEQTVLDWHSRYKVKSVRFDPYQMVPVSQRLNREGVPMEEFAQTIGNLTEASSNLYELVTGRNLIAYPNEDLRVAIARAVAIEGARGWKISKEKAGHKIDVVVALAMAAHAAVLAHKKKPQHLTMGFFGYGGRVTRVDPVTLAPLAEPQRTRIRWVKIAEKLAPASRGP